ncbi:type II toxin-antitoxin system RelE/ParE family toxin [bacterium]|nr:type II toxin-antitoxin system RelE/ParE family toxin [bacterium]
MSRYEITILPAALKQLESLPVGIRRRIAAGIDSLSDNPRPEGCRKLAGSDNLYRLRQGDYRVVYEVRDAVLVVLVIRLGHRKDIYRR